MSDDQPVFYFDYSSPYSYLAAERINSVLPVVPRWQPISFGFLLRHTGRTPWSLRPGREADMEIIERRAAERGLPRLRWPEGWPVETYSIPALRAGIFAAQSGRVVAYSLAAFRQAFAGGHDLGERDNVLIAAAACELHPVAVIKGAELASTRRRLDDATDRAVAAGVVTVPAVRVGERVFYEDALEEAGALLQSAIAP